MATDNPPAPEVGTVYEDENGARCEVKSITTSAAFPGFYLVHLRITPKGDGKEDTWVLGPREFQAVCRERGLRPAS
jgi:hypothetical protein